MAGVIPDVAGDQKTRVTMEAGYRRWYILGYILVTVYWVRY